MTNEIIILDDKKQITPTELFTPNGIDKILADIKAQARSFVGDMTTEEGRKSIASMAYKVARTKTALDNEGKKLTEDWARQKSMVDAERKRVREELDALRDEIRAPLDEYEAREEKRIAACQGRLAEIEVFKSLRDVSPAQFDEAVKKVAGLLEFDWNEFSFKAKTIADETTKYLVGEKEKAIKSEEEKAELDRLRKEKEERERKDREEKIANEAAAKARLEAEEKALADKQRVEQEQKKKDEEAQRAKEKAEQEARDREAKIDADRKAAEQAKIDAENRAKKAEQDAKDAAAKAVETERLRVEAKKKADEEAQAKREANQRHCNKINKEAITAINQILANSKTDLNFHEKISEIIVEAISKGEVPNISIKY